MDVVTGAGGFIGGHLVRRLLAEGRNVRAVDIRPIPEWEQVHDVAVNVSSDMAHPDAARDAVRGAERVFNLACDMGGMGFIETHKAECMLSVLISTNVLNAARLEGVQRYFYSSSACVYNAAHQDHTDVTALVETSAYPADPEDGYGWEKLFSERMARHFMEDFGMATRVARYHNVYGPHGTFFGGREKAPAALSRKMALVELGRADSIDIWGDGEQTRSFTFIDDCIRGTLDVINGDFAGPVNLGSTELVSINQLVDILESITGLEPARNYDLSAPQGVRGRNSDNTLFEQTYGWQPSTALVDGLRVTYEWVRSEVEQRPDIVS
ncbi:MAG: NAD-dependent epimerase/dehydratase family protein [Microbacteriaceae bacterium]